MPLEPLNPATTAASVPLSLPTTATSTSPGEPADAQAIVRRLDWLFRHAPPTPAMQQLRDIVQRYRLGARP